MSVAAKICGVNAPAAIEAAAAGGAAFVGLAFYPPSPRHVSPEEAAALVRDLPAGIKRVGLFVDVDDTTLEATLAVVALDMLQFHGAESPKRVRAAKARFGLPVMKAIKLAEAADLAAGRAYLDAADYAGIADRLLFDAKAPASMTGALPGGNALSFDWTLLEGVEWPLPWMLSGGLDPENVAEAVRLSGAATVDVSSGVEVRPGHKDPARIHAFLEAVRRL